MDSLIQHFLLILITFLPLFNAQQPTMFPFPCTKQLINTCTSTLYHTTTNSTTTLQQLAHDYSVQPSQIKPITHIDKQDFLITVPCSCQTADNLQTTSYFYNVDYTVKQGDTFFDVSTNVYSGQVWPTGDEQGTFVIGNNVTMNLLCGCINGSRAEEKVVTYTVQDKDTLFGIASMLGSDLGEIQKLNNKLLGNSSSGLIDVGWVLYVPVRINGTLFT